MYSHMANGCASLSPIIKQFLSFHLGVQEVEDKVGRGRVTTGRSDERSREMRDSHRGGEI